MKRQFLIKKIVEKVWHDVLELEKTLEYLKIQESLLSENVTKYYRNIFICFLYPERYYTNTK